MGPRAGLDGCGKSPACSESLYRLSYADRSTVTYSANNFPIKKILNIWVTVCKIHITHLKNTSVRLKHRNQVGQ